MFKKEAVLLVCSMVLLVLAVTVIPARASNPFTAMVHGNSRMTVPLSVFDPDLEGEAEMVRLHYNLKLRDDGTVTGNYEYILAILGTVDTVRGSAFCLKAEGNRAWIGATVDETTDPTLEGLFSWWQVEDQNGPGDKTTFLGFGTLQETIDYCQGPNPNFIFEIDQGNIKVLDFD